MSEKAKDKIRITIMVVIIFILCFIFGRLVGEQIKLNRSSEKLKEIQAQYEELTEEYNRIHSEVVNELNEDI